MAESEPRSKVGLAESFRCAGRGIVCAARGRNFKIECFIGAAAFILCWAFDVTGAEFLVVVLFTVAVLAAECANTALVAAVDLASPERSDLARLAKDCSAGAVLLLSIGALFAACIIFLPKIIAVLWG